MKNSTAPDRYIDRPFNIRPLCLWAFFVTVTIVMCLWSVWALVVWLVVLFGGLFACQFIKAKDAVVKFFGSSRLFFVGTIAVCLAAVLSFGITSISYTNQKSFHGAGTLTGTVESFRIVDDEYCAFTLSNAQFVNSKFDQRLSGRVSVYLSDTQNARALDLQFGAKVSIAQVWLKTSSASEQNINNRVKYSATIDSVNFTVTGQSNSVRHVISRASKGFIEKYLSPVNAELMYAMLFGDKSALDEELRSDFAITGLAHALAVSGLHVGIIIGMLTALLKLCRVRRKVQFPIILVVLLAYCFLCDFRFSILRASIMFLVFLGNRIYLRNSDPLSSLSLAGITTLILFPHALLSVSFQLSYACMLGMALFARPIEKTLRKISFKKLPRFLDYVQNSAIRGVSIYACVTITTLPILIKVFGVVPVFGLVANLLIIPILVLCFQVVLLSLCTYITYPLLYIANWLLDFVRWAMGALASTPISQIHISNDGYWFLFYLVAVVIMTRFVFIPRKIKYAAAVGLFCVYSIGFLV